MTHPMIHQGKPLRACRGWPTPPEMMAPPAPADAIALLEEMNESLEESIQSALLEQRIAARIGKRKTDCIGVHRLPRTKKQLNQILTERNLRRALIDEALTIGECGRKFGVDPDAVLRRARWHGIPYRRADGTVVQPDPKYRKTDAELIDVSENITRGLALARSGMSILAAAKAVGVKYNRLYRAIHGRHEDRSNHAKRF